MVHMVNDIRLFIDIKLLTFIIRYQNYGIRKEDMSLKNSTA